MLLTSKVSVIPVLLFVFHYNRIQHAFNPGAEDGASAYSFVRQV